MKRTTQMAVLGSAILGLGMSGCGWFSSSLPHIGHPLKHLHQTTAPPSAGGNGVNSTNTITTGTNTPVANNTVSNSPSNGTASNTPSNGTSNASSNTTSNGTSSGSSGGSTQPPPPNSGAYSNLKMQIVSVKADGTASTSGASEPVYLVTLTVENPTSGVISLYLNDFSAIRPGGPYSYSWNDYVSTGLSSQNSLFNWPVNPSTPNSNSRYVFPGKSITGVVTVEVPAGSSQYQMVWGAPNSGSVATTFTP